jgi:hypothetical protein
MTTTPDMQTSPQLTGLTKAQAESLLDWLESQGRTGCTVTCDEQGYFTIQLPQPVEPAAS